ncbi:hypothetical protein OHA70_02830 [Kribbella sp. NBC_00382]|uniref:hypothetical protein n=1 Tax=Kribbella sp. NBC_00382 TaxID=2975967 RepID=UPI002E248330
MGVPRQRWREVLGWLCAVGALVAGVVAVGAWWTGRPWTEPTAVVNGTVVELRASKDLYDDAGYAYIRYSADGSEHQLKTDWVLQRHKLQLNELVPIEYTVARPDRSRAVWFVDRMHSTTRISSYIGGGFGVLALFFGTSYVIGARRVRRR